MRRSAFVVAAGLAVVALIAVVAFMDSGLLDARPSPTPSPTSLPTASASPPAVLDDRFGFVSVSSASVPSSRRDGVRRESSAQQTHDLADGLGTPRRTVPSNNQLADPYGLAVSRDGSHLAYWTAIGADQLPLELQVLDVAAGARPRTVVTLTQEFGDVVGESVVWSSDGTGLVFGVGESFLKCGCCAPSCPPKYSALYLLDAAGGKPREVVTMRGNSIVPVAWDRQAHLVAAFEFEGRAGGRVLAYDVVEESGVVKRTQMVIGTGGSVTVSASDDAKQVLAHEFASPGQVVRVWPLASPDNVVELSPRGEQIFAPARWRPGTRDIGVLFADRLELWDAAGAQRRVPLPPSLPDFRPFFFRVDGSAAFVGTYGQTSSYVAVELASGRSAVIPGDDWLSASLRLGP